MPFREDSYTDICQKIGKLLQSKQSLAGEVQVVAASKQQDAGSIIEAIGAGITYFGENKVQEAETKWPEIKQKYPNITLQMIGSLQSNKAEAAVALFDEILTLDRESLAKALKKEMEKQGRWPNVMIQVNIGEEEQKGGVLPGQADAFICYCIEELELPVVGLMCVPPAGEYPAPYFALLNTIAKRHGLKRLSMGMSSDFETAIRLGATEIRLGTVLFGARVSQ